MPRILLLDYEKCKPEQCNNGTCMAVLACPLNILEQEEPYDRPMRLSSVCKGCMACVKACPFDAVDLE